VFQRKKTYGLKGDGTKKGNELALRDGK